MIQAPLAGLGILVTRPAHQAEHLANLIRQAGAEPILFPALEIVDLPDLQPLQKLIERLDEYDLAIFISPNAVNKAMNLIRAKGHLPVKLRIAAIGKGSAKVLTLFGVKSVITPQQNFDSEALLDMPALRDVTDQRIVIFRGDGGRELLGDTLTARGAQVEYAECYRRQKPQADNGKLLYLWARNELHAITVTSSEVLRNLYDLVGKLGQQWLKKTPVFVPHIRIAQAAQELGLKQVIVTEAGDENMLASIVAWRVQQQATER